MSRLHMYVAISCLTIAGPPAASEVHGAGDSNVLFAEYLATDVSEPVPEIAATSGPAPKAPPLPFHTIEGVGGACITPSAYLVNPGPEGTIVGMPTLSSTYVGAGNKSVQTVAVTETLFRRVELGYAFSRFDLGALPDAITKATGLNCGADDVHLHHFNLRGLLIEENSFDLPLPAVTGGVHFKYSSKIRDIDRCLGGALTGIGFQKSNGVDFTLTASKMFPDVLGCPLIVSSGVRFSRASHIGYFGFGDSYSATYEGHVICLPTDWLAVAYEFRHKEDPYSGIPGLVEIEDNWHAICVGLICNEHLTFCAGWASMGDLGNSTEHGAWAAQLKWEF